MSETVFLFPPFIIKYKGDEVDWLEKNNVSFDDELLRFSEKTEVDLSNFHIKKNNFCTDELKNQLMTYFFSCLIFDILKKKKPVAALSGLSMGLYAALYASGSLSFIEGAMIIKRAYGILCKIVHHKKYKMLAVIGLSSDDITNIINSHKLNCEIGIKNSTYSYIISGEETAVQIFSELALAEGAIHLTEMPVTIPYHSAALSSFEGYKDSLFSNLSICKSRLLLYSSKNQKKLVSPNDIADEIVKNVFQPINWQEHIGFFVRSGTYEFVECGPGNSLKRSGGFIEGDFKMISAKEAAESD